METDFVFRWYPDWGRNLRQSWDTPPLLRERVASSPSFDKRIKARKRKAKKRKARR